MELDTFGAPVAIAIAIAGAIYAVIRAGYASARYDDAERRISALRGDLQDAKNREERMDRSIVELTTRVRALEDENRTLRSFVPTQDELEEVKRLAQVHYDESTAFFQEFRQGAAVVIRQMWESIAEMKRTLGGTS